MHPKTRSSRDSIFTPRSAAPRSRQDRFPTLKLSSSANRTPSTVPRTKQQTLTQIDFVSRANTDRGSDLDYIHPETPPRKKRRRKSKIPEKDDKTLTQIDFVRKLQNEDSDSLDYLQPDDETLSLNESSRLSSYKGIGAVSRQRNLISQQEKRKHGNNASVSIPAGLAIEELMPPPQTPRKIYKQEIASSQSPEGSLTSTRSLSPGKRRVPLQELPVNLSRSHTLGKEQIISTDNIRTPLLKVEDTFSPSQAHTVSTWQHASSTPMSKRRNIIKFEIEDTDAELDLNDDDDDDYDYDENFPAYNSTNERVVTLPSKKLRDSGDSANNGSPESRLVGFPPENLLRQKHINEAQDMLNDIHSRSGVSSQLPSNDSPLAQSLCRNESAQASAQLLHDLSRHLLPNMPAMTIETESQYDAAFRPLWTSDLMSNSSPTGGVDATLMLVPTSQATTVDATEPSPKVQTPQKIPVTTSAVLSSPPKQQFSKERVNPTNSQEVVIPSSPIPNQIVQAVKDRWNAERLTDSQLLPDSIMNFELPPLETQESQADESS